MEDNFKDKVQSNKLDFLDELHEDKIVCGLQELKVRLSRDEVLDADISKGLLEISGLMVSLGVMVGNAKLFANEAYSYRKWRTAHDFKKIRAAIDKKIGEAEMEAQNGLQSELVDEIVKQYKADTLETFYDDMDRFYRALARRLDFLSLDFKKTK